MSVTKTYQIVIKYEKDDAGFKGSRREGSTFSSYTEPELSESDLAYEELQKIVLERIQNVVPISQGSTSAHIVGTVSES